MPRAVSQERCSCPRMGRVGRRCGCRVTGAGARPNSSSTSRRSLDPLDCTTREKTLTGPIYGSEDPAVARPGRRERVRVLPQFPRDELGPRKRSRVRLVLDLEPRMLRRAVEHERLLARRVLFVELAAMANGVAQCER